MTSNTRTLMGGLTLEDKASLVTSTNFWQNTVVPRLGIPSIVLSVGLSCGIRRSRDQGDLPLGKVTSSGQLAKSFPICRNHPRASLLSRSWPSRRITRGILVGHRYGKATTMEPLFSLDDGLRYADFTYRNLWLRQFQLMDAVSPEVTKSSSSTCTNVALGGPSATRVKGIRQSLPGPKRSDYHPISFG